MKLTIIDSDFEKILKNREDNIQHLQLIKCQITTIPVLQFQSIRLLDVSHNCIEDIKNLPQELLYLNISFNQIYCIQMSELPKTLQSLNMSYNPINQKRNYRASTIKLLKDICPNILYLDNVQIKYLDVALDTK